MLFKKKSFEELEEEAEKLTLELNNLKKEKDMKQKIAAAKAEIKKIKDVDNPYKNTKETVLGWFPKSPLAQKIFEENENTSKTPLKSRVSSHKT